ncbi:kinase-like domain-containing protein, partial [Spinellus fusiger]
LIEPSSVVEKRRSLRNLLNSLAQSKHRTNAEKIEQYLHQCSFDPIVCHSSLLKDFFTPQRDEDCILLKQKKNTLESSVALEGSHVDSTLESRSQIEPKVMLLEHLEVLKVLGKGCMGKVFLVRSRTTQELRALKSIIKDLVIEQREITHTLTEREILATFSGLDHPFLAKLHASFQDERRLYLMTDYYCGGDLATQMSTCYTFTPERVLFYAAEIIEGIGELHRLGVLYRDLKPENILLTAEGHIVLTDFGLSKWLTMDEHAQTTQTFCGTAEYLAPEILLGESYSFGIDHWSYGTIIFEMLTGITPFWADNHAEMYRRVLQDPLEFPTDMEYDTADLLAGLLDREPSTRMGAHGVEEIKAHSYFSSVSWDDVYRRQLVPPYRPNLKSHLD